MGQRNFGLTSHGPIDIQLAGSQMYGHQVTQGQFVHRVVLALPTGRLTDATVCG